MAEKKIVSFSGKVIRKVYGNDDNFRIYAFDVDEEEIQKNNLKKTIYGSVSVLGQLHELGEGLVYKIKAEEKCDPKNGYSYRVINITRDKPKSSEDMYEFLKEILTEQQAETLYKAYPTIVDKVIHHDLDDIDLNKTPGIKEYTFNVIKQKIADNYLVAELVVEFKGYLTMAMIKKIYDTYPSLQGVRNALKKDPYEALMRLSGVGFIKADNILLELEKEKVIDFGFELKSSKQRCLACVLHQLEQNEQNGNTVMDIIELRKVVMKLTPACAEHFVDCLKNTSIYYDKNKMICSRSITHDTEKYIADSIKFRLSIQTEKWNYDVEKYRNACGIPLSDEQMCLLTSVLNNQFVVLSSPGGTGKSFSTKALIDMLIDNGKTVILTSPTGKAAKKLSDYTSRDANTIHRTLGYSQGKFSYNEENPLTADVILIDEFGMVDIWLFKSLLSAITPSTKVVLVGDPYQLASCGAGNCLNDIIESNKVPIVRFTKVFRLGEGGALTACTYVRERKKFITDDAMTQLGTDKSYTFIPASKEKINKMIYELYKKLITTYSPKDVTVISSYNIGDNGCNVLNTMLQPLANPNARSNNDNFIKVQQDKNEVRFYIGDSVLQNVNNYHASIYYGKDFVPDEDDETFVPNGTQGTVIDILDKNKMVIDFDGVQVLYTYADLSSIKHAFAMSTHKMQGSQNKVIIFCAPSSHTFMLSNNLVYTALSRAEKVAYHLSDYKTMNYAMNKSENKNRRTQLCDLLKINNNKGE